MTAIPWLRPHILPLPSKPLSETLHRVMQLQLQLPSLMCAAWSAVVPPGQFEGVSHRPSAVWIGSLSFHSVIALQSVCFAHMCLAG